MLEQAQSGALAEDRLQLAPDELHRAELAVAQEIRATYRHIEATPRQPSAAYRDACSGTGALPAAPRPEPSLCIFRLDLAGAQHLRFVLCHCPAGREATEHGLLVSRAISFRDAPLELERVVVTAGRRLHPADHIDEVLVCSRMRHADALVEGRCAGVVRRDQPESAGAGVSGKVARLFEHRSSHAGTLDGRDDGHDFPVAAVSYVRHDPGALTVDLGDDAVVQLRCVVNTRWRNDRDAPVLLDERAKPLSIP